MLVIFFVLLFGSTALAQPAPPPPPDPPPAEEGEKTSSSTYHVRSLGPFCRVQPHEGCPWVVTDGDGREMFVDRVDLSALKLSDVERREVLERLARGAYLVSGSLRESEYRWTLHVTDLLPIEIPQPEPWKRPGCF